MPDTDTLRLLVDALIAFTLVEMVVLAVLHRRRGRGPSLRELAPGLGAGLMLMGAVRCALTPGAGWLMLVFIAGSGLCHAADLRRRFGANTPPR